MIKKVLAMVAVALTAMLLLPPDPADARRGGGGFRAGGGGGGGAFRAGGFRHRVIVHRPIRVVRPVRYVRPIRVIRTGPVFVAGYGGCEWLRRRAVVTGSPYWWSRYRACRGW